MDVSQFEARKRDHLRHALDPLHQAEGLSGLDRVHLIHDALPEIDFSQVELNSQSLGRSVRTPFFVSGMTAGHSEAVEINRRLALACARRGWAMGVGSQRRQLSESSGEVDQWTQLRQQAPKLTLFANLGATQIVGMDPERIQSLVDSISAQALVVHLNSLQEVIQPEGTPKMRGVVDALRILRSRLGVPLVIKETGCGFSERALRKIADLRLAAVDIAGLGGTHWGRIEGARAEEQDPVRSGAAKTFAEWGEPTADSVLAAAKTLPASTEIWASGGVRSGLDAAKLIALGATQVGYAKPALEAALQGEEKLDQWMERQEFELRTALFCTGTLSPAHLKGKESLWRRKPCN